MRSDGVWEDGKLDLLSELPGDYMRKAFGGENLLESGLKFCLRNRSRDWEKDRVTSGRQAKGKALVPMQVCIERECWSVAGQWSAKR